MHRRSKCNRGFSLIEAVIALSVIAVSAVVVTAIVAQGLMGARGVDASSEAVSTIDELRMALGTRKRCTMNLQGTPVSMAQVEGAPIVTKNWKGYPNVIALGYYDATDAPLTSVLELNKASGKLIAIDMRIIPKAQVDTTKYVGDLTITFQKTNASGAQSIVRRLPLDIDTKAGLLVSCSSYPESDVRLITDLLCTVDSGGSSTVDPVTGECIPRESKWYPGTLYSAKCPAGTKIALGGENCRGEEPPNFNDPYSTYTRTFVKAGATQFYLPLSIAVLNQTSGTCECDYPQGLNTAGFACSIRCEKLTP